MRATTDSAVGFLAISGPALLLYLALAGTISTFELATGALSAIVVGIFFADIAFETAPTVRRTPLRVARCILFVPYLCWEVMKANVTMAYLILHPSLPIDAHFERYETPDVGTLELSALATSITLTPGTLISDIDDSSFEVHVLTDAAWDGLLSGELERAVGFVFAGRAELNAPTPRERMDEESAARRRSVDD